MYKILKANADAYITNKIVNAQRAVSGNTGIAGTLDLFKLYGITSTNNVPNNELSRLLIHFDLQPLRDLISSGSVDTSNESFYCKLQLHDVYGGQPTPREFTVDVYPLSASFREGLGKDVVYYSDRDQCNFLSSTHNTAWYLSGCALAGGPADLCDYITASLGVSNHKTSQYFTTGEEDMFVDVTRIVSSTLANHIPDSGFRISFSSAIESDTHTYFVKRFASRNAYDVSKHPKLIVGFDDSIRDDSQITRFDSSTYLFMYNYDLGQLTNVVSSSVQITGSNSMKLKLRTEISGGFYELQFSGSQHIIGYASGVYSSSVLIPSTDATLATKLAVSGSVDFTPIWGSNDGTVSYLTGSRITAYPSLRTNSVIDPKKYVITVIGLNDTHRSDEVRTLKVHIFDHTSPLITVTRVPVELPGIVVRDVYYSVRDAVTNDVVIPFDTDRGSTRVSSDASGMFFKLDFSNLTAERTYVVDILINSGGNRQKYLNVSPVFRVSDLL